MITTSTCCHSANQQEKNKSCQTCLAFPKRLFQPIRPNILFISMRHYPYSGLKPWLLNITRIIQVSWGNFGFIWSKYTHWFLPWRPSQFRHPGVLSVEPLTARWQHYSMTQCCSKKGSQIWKVGFALATSGQTAWAAWYITEMFGEVGKEAFVFIMFYLYIPHIWRVCLDILLYWLIIEWAYLMRRKIITKRNYVIW